MILKEALAMQETIKNLITQRLPFSLAYKLSKIAQKLDEQVEFYTKNLHDLVDEYGEKDENGEIITDKENNGSIVIKTEKIEDFQNKIIELQSIEVGEDIPTLTLMELEDKIELTTQEVLSLMPIIKE